jgi:hypothetical protein
VFSVQPSPELLDRCIGMLGRVARNRRVQPSQFAWCVRMLWTRRDLSRPLSPLPHFDNIRHADHELRRHRPRTSFRCQDPIPQILRICLPSTPRHYRLRSMPEAYESHLMLVPESPIAIPVPVRPL